MRTTLARVIGAGLGVGLNGVVEGNEIRRPVEPVPHGPQPLRWLVIGVAMILGVSDVTRADLHDDQSAAKLTGLGATFRRDSEGRITAVNLFPAASKVTDADLGCIAGLTSLRTLFLVETNLTDAGLVHFQTLPALTTLYLGGDHTDAAGVTWMGGIGLTDAGLANLAGLGSLRTLSLGSAGFTDAGLAHLTRLTGLNELSLAGSGVKGGGLSRLDVLPGLSSLVLGPITFDADGLKPLADPRSLRSLMFYKSKLVGDRPGAARFAHPARRAYPPRNADPRAGTRRLAEGARDDIDQRRGERASSFAPPGKVTITSDGPAPYPVSMVRGESHR